MSNVQLGLDQGVGIPDQQWHQMVFLFHRKSLYKLTRHPSQKYVFLSSTLNSVETLQTQFTICLRRCDVRTCQLQRLQF